MLTITPDPMEDHAPPVPGDVPNVLGRRVAAAFVDIAAMGVLFVVVALTMGQRSVVNGEFYIGLQGTAALVYFGLVLLYFFALEAATGRTLGKMLLGLKVVREDGGRAGPGAIAVRTLFRFVDGLPAFYLVGFIVAVSLESRQRVGDIVAKTLVVRRRIGDRTARPVPS